MSAPTATLPDQRQQAKNVQESREAPELLEGGTAPKIATPAPEDSETRQSREDLAARQREIASLCAFQRRAMAALDDDVAEIDVEISDAELRVADMRNRVDALRGLMHKRAGVEGRKRDGGEGQGATGDTDASVVPPPRQKTHDCRGRSVAQWGAGERSISGGDSLGGKTESRDTGCTSVPVVGVVYSEFSKRFEAPRQSFQGPAGEAVVSLADPDDSGVQASLAEVKPGARVWLIYHFDRNSGFWREMVRPPRAKGGWRVGVFATRSPHRPTPVGLSLADVVRVEHGKMHVRGVDILDETPLVGWRIYDKATDSHVGLKSGWLDDTQNLQPLYYDALDVEDSAVEEVDVEIGEVVRGKLDFINERSTIDIRGMLLQTLSRMVRTENEDLRTLDGRSEKKPSPFEGEDSLALMYPVGAWRVWYGWDSTVDAVRVLDITSGIRQEVMFAEGDVDREVRVHRDFSKEFALVKLI